MNQANSSVKQLVVIDPQVNGWQNLVAHLGAGTAVLVLDGASDGLTQISDYLSDFTDPLQSIHVLSHGGAASLSLGSSVINGENIENYSQQLAAIGSAMTDSGDILLYGCDVAQGEAGSHFIDRIAQLSGADVAASRNLTGAAARGGDWQLEQHTGSIESALVFDGAAMENYAGVLLELTAEQIKVLLEDFLKLVDGLPGHESIGSITAEITNKIKTIADHVTFETTDEHTEIHFTDVTGLTLIVDTVDKVISNSGHSDLLAVDYKTTIPSLAILNSDLLDGLLPDEVEFVISNAAVTSVSGVAVGSGVSLISSIDLEGSTNPLYKFENEVLGISTIAVLVNADEHNQSVTGVVQLGTVNNGKNLFHIGEFSVDANNFTFGVALRNKLPEFVGSQTFTYKGYDPTQSNEPDLVVSSGIKIDLSSVSLFGQVETSDFGGWNNPFGFQGGRVNALALQVGATYQFPFLDNLGIVADLKWSQYDFRLATHIDINTPANNGFALTLNKEVNLVQLWAQMSAGLMPGAQALLIAAKPLFNYIPLTVVSVDSDGDQVLDPLIKFAPVESQIGNITLEAGMEMNAQINLGGQKGTLTFHAGANFETMGGSLEIDNLKLSDVLTISGTEAGSPLTASFNIDPGHNTVNFAGDGKIVLFGTTLAQSKFLITEKSAHIESSFNLGVIQLKDFVMDMKIDGTESSASGHGDLVVLGEIPIANAEFSISKDHIDFKAAIWLDVMQFDAMFHWDSQAKKIHADGKLRIKGTELAKGTFDSDAAGNVTMTGMINVDVKNFGKVDAFITAKHTSDGAISVKVHAQLSGLPAVDFSIDTGSFDAEKLADHLASELAGQLGNNIVQVSEIAGNLIAGGVLTIYNQAAHAFTSTEVKDSANKIWDAIKGNTSDLDPTSWFRHNSSTTGKTFIGGDGIDKLPENSDKSDMFFGNGGNDKIEGNKGHDYIDGGTGDDTLDGQGDNDTIYGGDGKDHILGGDGQDRLFGGAGNDTIEGQGGYDLIFGDSGDDTITDYSGFDTTIVTQNALFGGDGNDTINGDGTLYGDNGNDTLTGSVESDYLQGDNGNDKLYGGGNPDTLRGGDGNDRLDGGAGADYMFGGNGNDTYVVDDLDDQVTEDFAEGYVVIDFVESSVTYTLGDNLEYLTLTGSAAINGTGNALDNTLTGNSAKNILTGGAGDDTYIITSADGDVVVEAVGEGIDTVNSAITYALGENVENLELTGNSAINGKGNELNNTLTGNSAPNTLTGGAGDDTYIITAKGADRDAVVEAVKGGIDTVYSAITYVLGKNVENLILTDSADINGTGNELNNTLTGNRGKNILKGGAGDDTYIITSADGDVVVEAVDGGTDTVRSAITYALGKNVENLILTEDKAINGTGNELNNTLTGNDASNLLDGGLGIDTLIGGAGNDTYIVDEPRDHVIETLALTTEIDTVLSSATDYTLSANVENLTLTGTGAINGTGNALDNILTGNAAKNVLSGGAGNDTYLIQNTDDVVVEKANEGSDTVLSSVTYTLSANVENLSLTGTAEINGTGNAIDNTITGNTARNILTGGGGNDTYIIQNTDDVVVEKTNEGTDIVLSSATYTLSANVENLTLTGTDEINGSGNALNNTLLGNEASNILTGGVGNDVLDGGAGADTLIGGSGNDTYFVDTPVDVVQEELDGGIDTVVSSSSVPRLGDNVENLTLIGNAYVARGNALDNIIIGNASNNGFFGSAGNDTLTGGGGRDDFGYLLNNNGIDTITDFGSRDSLTIETFNNGTAAFVNSALGLGLGRIYLSNANDVTTLEIGTNDTPGADLTIRLLGNFTAADFEATAPNDNLVISLKDRPANHAPTGADTTVTLPEDGSYALKVSDFGFADANDIKPNALKAVIINSLPPTGSLTLHGLALIGGQTVNVADIAAGALVFAPALNANGLASSSFNFQLQDNGGVVDGGRDTDPLPNKLSFDVTPVDDVSVITSAKLTLQETNAPVSANGVLSITDVDSAASFVAQVGTAGKYGVFTLGTTGTWGYQANAAYDYLNPGDSLVDQFSVTAIDGSVGSVSVTIAGTAEATIVHLGDAPVRQSGTGGQWAQAWTHSGFAIDHKADYSSATEVWSKASLSGVSSQVLSGGDIYSGNLGVSGQSLASSTVKQEIDGKEALRFSLPSAAESVTITLANLFAKDDGGILSESGLIRLLDATGHVVAEKLFVADSLLGNKTVTLASAVGFVSMELLAGAYDNVGNFVYGAYSTADGVYGGAGSKDAAGVHGSDFLLHSVDFAVSLIGQPIEV